MPAIGAWSPEFFNADAWLRAMDSFVHATTKRPTVFVVGSGVSCERDDTGHWVSGVWDVRKILEYIEQRHGIPISSAGAEAYGQAFRTLRGQATNEDVVQVIREAVLAACHLSRTDPVRERAQAGRADHGKPGCLELSKLSPDHWDIPRAALSLAELVHEIVGRRKDSAALGPVSVMTTNFDELLELGLCRNAVHGACRTLSLVKNEYPSQQGHAIEILHVHGTWRDSEMIHEPAALTANRDSLKQALWRRFDGAKICVLGYGGWNDIVFGTVAEMLENRAFEEPPEVWWTFYERDSDDAIGKKYPSIFQRLSGIHGRLHVKFYKGIDLNTELPKVVAALRARRAAGTSAGSAASSPGAPAARVSTLRPSDPNGLGDPDQARRRLLAAAPKTDSELLDDPTLYQPDASSLSRLIGTVNRALGQRPLREDKPARLAFARVAEAVFQRQVRGVFGAAFAELDITQNGPVAARWRTPTMSEEVMAIKQRRDEQWVRDGKEIVPEDLIFDGESTGSWLEEGPPQKGRPPEEFLRNLESDLYAHLIGGPETYDPDRHAKKLKGEIEAATDSGHRPFGVTGKTHHWVDWKLVCESLQGVTLFDTSERAGEPFTEGEERLVANLRRFYESVPELLTERTVRKVRKP